MAEFRFTGGEATVDYSTGIVTVSRGGPTYTLATDPPEEAALRAEIAAHAAAGREAEREAAADRLAAAIMRRTLPRRDER